MDRIFKKFNKSCSLNYSKIMLKSLSLLAKISKASFELLECILKEALILCFLFVTLSIITVWIKFTCLRVQLSYSIEEYFCQFVFRLTYCKRCIVSTPHNHWSNFYHIRRQANGDAHQLARYALHYDLLFNYFENPPNLISKFII